MTNSNESIVLFGSKSNIINVINSSKYSSLNIIALCFYSVLDIPEGLTYKVVSLTDLSTLQCKVIVVDDELTNEVAQSLKECGIEYSFLYELNSDSDIVNLENEVVPDIEVEQPIGENIVEQGVAVDDAEHSLKEGEQKEVLTEIMTEEQMSEIKEVIEKYFQQIRKKGI